MLNDFVIQTKPKCLLSSQGFSLYGKTAKLQRGTTDPPNGGVFQMFPWLHMVAAGQLSFIVANVGPYA
jgi:hypothetical protein